MTCIFPPFPPLYKSLCTRHPPTLEGFIGYGSGYAILDAQPNYPHIYQTPLHVYHSRSYLTHEDL